MGFLSSLFSFGDSPTTKTTQVTPQFPEELKPYIEEILKGQQTVYESKIDEGYKPYTGETIAGFTPEEIASQEGLKALIGTQAPLQQEALDLARGTSRKFTPEEAQKYMSPYLRTALDAQKAAAQRQFEGTKLPQFEKDAVAAGGMSGLGSRAGVQAAELQAGQNRLLADIEAKGQQQAYEQAVDLFKDQARREAAVGTTLAQAAPQIFKSGLLEQGTLQTIGEQKRNLAQSALDEAYLKFIEQKQYPESALASYQSAIYGNPLLKQPSYTQTGTTTGGSPGLGKTLLGLGATAMGFGVPGGGTIGGSIFKNAFPSMFKAGGGSVGGLSSTPQARPYINYMRRNMGGKVVPPVVYRQENGQVVGEDDRSTFMKFLFPGPSRQRAFKPSIKLPVGPPSEEQLKILKDKRRKQEGIISSERMKKYNQALKSQDFEERYRKANPAERIEMDRRRRLENEKIVPLNFEEKIDIAPSPDVNVELPKMPEEGFIESGITLPDFIEEKDEGGKFLGDEDSVSKLAEVTKTQTQLNIVKKAKGDPTIIERIEKGFKKYKENAGALLDKNPLEKQKFWATIGAAIMKPGNAFANMAQGIKEAIDGLDADGKTKRKLRLALIGKEFEKDITIAKTQASTQASKLEAITKLKIAAMKVGGKERIRLLDEAAAIRKTLLGGKSLDSKQFKAGLLGLITNEKVKDLVDDIGHKKLLGMFKILTTELGDPQKAQKALIEQIRNNKNN